MNLIHKSISFGQNPVCRNISCEILLHPIFAEANTVIACVVLLIRICTKETNKLYLQESLKTSPRKRLFNLLLKERKFTLGLRVEGKWGEKTEVSGRVQKKNSVTRENLIIQYNLQTRRHYQEQERRKSNLKENRMLYIFKYCPRIFLA